MPKVTLRFDPSLDELKSKFGEIKINTFLKTQIKKIAFRIEGESKKVAPVDTGLMRSRITTTILGEGLRAEVEPKVHYGIFVHEGTRYMAARPFLVWGAQRVTPTMEKDIARDLDSLISGALN